MSVDVPPEVTLGVDTFGDVSNDADGHPVSHAEAIRMIVEQGVLADQVGLDHFAVGEHHITEMPVTAPDVVLAAIAGSTRRIRLGSAVTVLSSNDPVRVYQRYATLDAVSGGRAEVILGRGSSVESFPLFGYDLADYSRLFEEKLDLFGQLRDEQPITWSGSTRAPLREAEVFPHTAGPGLSTWVGVGGSPESVVRAARHRMHLMLAVVGGDPVRFAPLAELYRQTAARLGHTGLRIGVHSVGHVAETDEQAVEEFWPYHRDFLPEATAARGLPTPTWASFQRAIGPEGSLYVGSPDSVAAKIVRTLRVVGASRFSLKYGVVGLGHDALMRNVHLFGTEVAPRVRAALATTGDPVLSDLVPSRAVHE